MATPNEIRSRYRKLAKRYHPDRNTDELSAKRFGQITKVYDILSDPKRRAKYDRRIGSPQTGIVKAPVAKAKEKACDWCNRVPCECVNVEINIQGEVTIEMG